MKSHQHLNSFLSDLQLRIITGRLGICDQSWAKQGFVPSFDKLYLVCEGKAWIQLDHRKIIMEPGHMLLIPSGFTQSFAVIGEEPMVKYWCHFKTNIDLLGLFRLYGLPCVIHQVDVAEWGPSFMRLIAHIEEGAAPAAPLIAKAELFRLISHYLHRALAAGTKEDAALMLPHLKQVMDYIDARLAHPITVGQLADSIHLHPNYFIAFFKKYTGTTPMRYIYKRRCEEARKIMLNTDKTLSQIAHETGFNDVSHLSKSFKKAFGVTPSRFKTEHQ